MCFPLNMQVRNTQVAQQIMPVRVVSGAERNTLLPSVLDGGCAQNHVETKQACNSCIIEVFEN